MVKLVAVWRQLYDLSLTAVSLAACLHWIDFISLKVRNEEFSDVHSPCGGCRRRGIGCCPGC